MNDVNSTNIVNAIKWFVLIVIVIYLIYIDDSSKADGLIYKRYIVIPQSLPVIIG